MKKWKWKLFEDDTSLVILSLQCNFQHQSSWHSLLQSIDSIAVFVNYNSCKLVYRMDGRKWTKKGIKPGRKFCFLSLVLIVVIRYLLNEIKCWLITWNPVNGISHKSWSIYCNSCIQRWMDGWWRGDWWQCHHWSSSISKVLEENFLAMLNQLSHINDVVSINWWLIPGLMQNDIQMRIELKHTTQMCIGSVAVVVFSWFTLNLLTLFTTRENDQWTGVCKVALTFLFSSLSYTCFSRSGSRNMLWERRESWREGGVTSK